MLAFLTATATCHAGFDLGDAANYAVLYEGSGSHNLQINSSPLNGNTILGNVGLGIENGGNPQLQFNSPAVITGNINFAHNPVNYQNSGGVLHGSVNAGVTQVETDLNNLNALSVSLGGESGTGLAINLSGTGGNQTVSAANGTLDGNGNRVFKLTSMTFNNGNTLTINGDAGHDSVVINVDKSLVNGPHFAGAILLTGGLTPDEVLINLTGGNNATLSGGDTLQTSANNAFQYCTYLDPNGTISVNSVNIVGHLYGGDSTDFQIVSGATVQTPVPEPATYMAAWLLLIPCGVSVLRVLRKNVIA